MTDTPGAPDTRVSSAPRTPPRTYVDATRLWVDSRLRYEIGLRVEGTTLAGFGARGDNALDVGTGRRGLGARVAVTLLGAGSVTALDVHETSVQAARRAPADLGERVVVERADATALPAADGSQDLVVSLQPLHHVEDWAAAVAEYARVLRPGGQLAYTEMTSRFIDSRWLRAVSRHPADRFTEEDLVSAFEGAGFDVPARTHRSRLGGRWLRGRYPPMTGARSGPVETQVAALRLLVRHWRPAYLAAAVAVAVNTVPDVGRKLLVWDDPSGWHALLVSVIGVLTAAVAQLWVTGVLAGPAGGRPSRWSGALTRGVRLAWAAVLQAPRTVLVGLLLGGGVSALLTVPASVAALGLDRLLGTLDAPSPGAFAVAAVSDVVASVVTLPFLAFVLVLAARSGAGDRIGRGTVHPGARAGTAPACQTPAPPPG